MANISTIRPGVLVSLKTSMQGNVHYDRQDLGGNIEGAVARKRWETERTIDDIDEFEEGGKVRAKAMSLIRGQCARSAFGLLCPEGNVENLNRAIAEARDLVNNFNANARLTRVSVYSIAGRIQPDDVEAVRAIKSEIRDLIADMTEGVKNLDPAVIRKAAQQARSVGQMLPAEAQERVKEAIATARKVATEIIKAGETAAVAVDKAVIKKLTEARTDFLDLDGDSKVEIKVGAGKGRALDFDTPAPKVERFKPNQPALDL